jgi:hypothetical protein
MVHDTLRVFLHYAITFQKSMLVVVFRIRNKGSGYCKSLRNFASRVLAPLTKNPGYASDMMQLPGKKERTSTFGTKALHSFG